MVHLYFVIIVKPPTHAMICKCKRLWLFLKCRIWRLLVFYCRLPICSNLPFIRLLSPATQCETVITSRCVSGPSLCTGHIYYNTTLRAATCTLAAGVTADTRVVKLPGLTGNVKTGNVLSWASVRSVHFLRLTIESVDEEPLIYEDQIVS